MYNAMLDVNHFIASKRSRLNLIEFLLFIHILSFIVRLRKNGKIAPPLRKKHRTTMLTVRNYT